MLKFQIIFLSLLVSTLQAADQANNRFLFKITGYESIVDVANYLNYQRFADMFEDIGPDGTGNDIPTLPLRTFITPEIMHNLEEIVRCYNYDQLVETLNRIYNQATVSYPALDARKILALMLAARDLEIQNPLFNFETIRAEPGRLTSINNLQLNFMHLFIRTCMNIFGNNGFLTQFLTEYKKYIVDQTLEKKPLLTFLELYQQELTDLDDQTGDAYFSNEGNIFAALNNFLKEVRNGDYSYVQDDRGSYQEYECDETLVQRYSDTNFSTNIILIITKNCNPEAEKVDALNLETNKMIRIHTCKPYNYICRATISRKGKYILISSVDLKNFTSNLYVYENINETYHLITENTIDFKQNRSYYWNRNQIDYTFVDADFNKEESKFFIHHNGLTKVYSINNKEIKEIYSYKLDVSYQRWCNNNQIENYTYYKDQPPHFFNTTNNTFMPTTAYAYKPFPEEDKYLQEFNSLNMENIPYKSAYNTLGNYYLTLSSFGFTHNKTIKIPLFKLYKKFTPSYIQSLSFIDQLFLSICVENHGCPVNDPVMHQHYFSFITEQFDPVRRTLFLSEKEKSKIKDFIKEEWNGVKDFFHRHSPRKFGKVGLL